MPEARKPRLQRVQRDVPCLASRGHRDFRIWASGAQEHEQSLDFQIQGMVNIERQSRRHLPGHVLPPSNQKSRRASVLTRCRPRAWDGWAGVVLGPEQQIIAELNTLEFR